MEKISYSLLKKLCSPIEEEKNESFNVIFKKYRYLVYYVSYDILKDEEEAKDVVSETFLKMYEKRQTFSNETKLKYFLLVVAKNLAINRYNKIKIDCSLNEDIEGKNDDINSSLYLDQFKEILDHDEYQYLVLHLIYDFTFKEIGKANNLTTSQVSSKYQRGLKKLRAYYQGEKNNE